MNSPIIPASLCHSRHPPCHSRHPPSFPRKRESRNHQYFEQLALDSRLRGNDADGRRNEKSKTSK